MEIALAYIRIAIATPFGALGLCAGLLMGSIFTHRRIRPTLKDWLFALLANVSNVIFLFTLYRNEPNANQLDLWGFIALLSGAGAFGLGWLARLIWLAVRPPRVIWAVTPRPDS